MNDKYFTTLGEIIRKLCYANMDHTQVDNKDDILNKRVKTVPA